MQFKPLLAVAMSALSGACTTPRPTRALVYRGPASSEGCPEAIAKLLQSSNHRFEVTYAGPDEDVDISAETLADYDIYAFGGGEGEPNSPSFPLCTSLVVSNNRNYRPW